jgi:hypothetical protein
MGHWIFQSNPKHFNLPGALAEAPAHGDVLAFLVKPRYAADIKRGDTVYLWFGGQRSPGLYATATVLTDPDKIPQEDWQLEFATKGVSHPWDAVETLRVRLKIECRLRQPVARGDVIGLSEMAPNSFVRNNAQGTNFPLTPDQASAIERLIPAPCAPGDPVPADPRTSNPRLAGGDIVVVELKRIGARAAGVVEQTMAYVGWARKHLAGPDQQVRGIIVGGKPDTKLQYAVDGISNLKFRSLNVSIGDVD